MQHYKELMLHTDLKQHGLLKDPKTHMKTTLAALLSLGLTALAQDPKAKDSDAKPNGERDGAATMLHRDAVLSDRSGGRRDRGHSRDDMKSKASRPCPRRIRGRDQDVVVAYKTVRELDDDTG